jgi:hypothetical protein
MFCRELMEPTVSVGVVVVSDIAGISCDVGGVLKDLQFHKFHILAFLHGLVHGEEGTQKGIGETV